jgi:hypothetical protein
VAWGGFASLPFWFQLSDFSIAALAKLGLWEAAAGFLGSETFKFEVRGSRFEVWAPIFPQHPPRHHVLKEASESYLKSARLEHGLLINFGSYKFEIRKYAWSENQPQRTQRTQRVIGFSISALSAFFAVE